MKFNFLIPLCFVLILTSCEEKYSKSTIWEKYYSQHHKKINDLHKILAVNYDSLFFEINSSAAKDSLSYFTLLELKNNIENKLPEFKKKDVIISKKNTLLVTVSNDNRDKVYNILLDSTDQNKNLYFNGGHSSGNLAFGINNMFKYRHKGIWNERLDFSEKELDIEELTEYDTKIREEYKFDEIGNIKYVLVQKNIFYSYPDINIKDSTYSSGFSLKGSVLFNIETKENIGQCLIFVTPEPRPEVIQYIDDEYHLGINKVMGDLEEELEYRTFSKQKEFYGKKIPSSRRYFPSANDDKDAVSLLFNFLENPSDYYKNEFPDYNYEYHYQHKKLVIIKDKPH